MSAFYTYKKQLGVYIALLIFILPMPSYAGGVGVGATRIIYPSDRNEVSLSVSNTDADRAYLIQSWIENAEGQLAKDFLITPPLFKIKKKSENSMRLMYVGAPLPEDRETLFLVNVKSIPSKSTAARREGQSTLQLAVVSRIKLFYRPSALTTGASDAALKVRVERAGDKLIVVNPTPHFVNLTKIAIGVHELKSTMIAPLAEDQIELPKGASGELTYSFLNDYGAEIKLK